MHKISAMASDLTAETGRQSAAGLAERLRRQILDGHLPDGTQLPRIDDLVAELGASRPTVRDALRILETQGLATVRRGRFGGAIVHRPQVVTAAHSLGLVLRANEVSADDLTLAIQRLDPLAVELCAEREDRAQAIVPVLQGLQLKARDVVDNPREFSVVSSRFHEALVEHCGNETVRIMLGALQVLWTAQTAAWVEATHLDEDDLVDRDYAEQSLRDHDLIVQLIAHGDGQSAARVAREHLAFTTSHLTRG